ERAVALDENLAEAHLALASFLDMFEWKWTEAEKEYQRAIALNPNYAVAHHWYSSFLLRMGRRQFASRENASALRLDPLSATIVTSTGQLVRDEGRFEEARVYFQKAIELDPAYSGAHFDLAENFRLAGMCKESVAALAKAHEIVGHAEQAAA